MSRGDARYIADVLDAIARIRSYLSAPTPSSALADDMLHDAIERNLTIVAEACTRLSAATKERHPTVDWRGIQGFRVMLVHRYWALDRDTVQQILDGDLRILAEALTSDTE